MAGAVFGDLGVSFFVAGAVSVFGEIWVDSRSAKCCNFQCIQNALKSKLCERTGSVLQFHGRIMFGSCSDHGRIGHALEMTLQLFSANFS